MAHRDNHHRVCKNPNHDGRHTVQKIGCIADKEAECLAAKFGEVNSSENSDGHAEKHRQKKQLSASDDGIGHSSARFADRCRQFREEIPIQVLSAMPYEVPKDEKEDE